jgi:hypothetical protein
MSDLHRTEPPEVGAVWRRRGIGTGVSASPYTVGRNKRVSVVLTLAQIDALIGCVVDAEVMHDDGDGWPDRDVANRASDALAAAVRPYRKAGA